MNNEGELTGYPVLLLLLLLLLSLSLYAAWSLNNSTIWKRSNQFLSIICQCTIGIIHGSMGFCKWEQWIALHNHVYKLLHSIHHYLHHNVHTCTVIVLNWSSINNKTTSKEIAKHFHWIWGSKIYVWFAINGCHCSSPLSSTINCAIVVTFCFCCCCFHFTSDRSFIQVR